VSWIGRTSFHPLSVRWASPRPLVWKASDLPPAALCLSGTELQPPNGSRLQVSDPSVLIAYRAFIPLTLFCVSAFWCVSACSFLIWVQFPVPWEAAPALPPFVAWPKYLYSCRLDSPPLREVGVTIARCLWPAAPNDSPIPCLLVHIAILYLTLPRCRNSVVSVGSTPPPCRCPLCPLSAVCVSSRLPRALTRSPLFGTPCSARMGRAYLSMAVGLMSSLPTYGLRKPPSAHLSCAPRHTLPFHPPPPHSHVPCVAGTPATSAAGT
jgi:hypothetical protein